VRHREALAGTDVDEDEDASAAAATLRFEISFHRPCGSQRRRHQRRQSAVEQARTRLRTEAAACETLELEMTQCVASVPGDNVQSPPAADQEAVCVSK